VSSNFLRNLVGPQVDENGNPVDDNGNPISVNPPADQADPQSETNPSFTGPNLGDPNLRNILDTDNPTPLGGPESDATSEETARELTPEPAPKVEPPDDTRKKALQQRIDDILNTPKAPYLEQNRGRYMELQSLQGLLHEEDASSNQDYQRRLQEQTMYGKNMTNQQRIEMQQQASMNSLLGRQYGADQGLAGRQYAADATSGARAYSSDNTLAGRQYAADQGLTGRLGAATIGADAHVQGAQIGAGAKNYATDANVAIQGMPRRSSSSGADNSAIPKLPADTQKRINAIVTDQTLSDQDKGNQLDQVLSPLGLAWSRLQKTIVRKPTLGSGGGIKGTNPATPAAASQSTTDPLGILS
jgi:hypothetical protein